MPLKFNPKAMLAKKVLIPLIVGVGGAFGVAVNEESAALVANLLAVFI